MSNEIFLVTEVPVGKRSFLDFRSRIGGYAVLLTNIRKKDNCYTLLLGMLEEEVKLYSRSFVPRYPFQATRS